MSKIIIGDWGCKMFFETQKHKFNWKQFWAEHLKPASYYLMTIRTWNIYIKPRGWILARPDGGFFLTTSLSLFLTGRDPRTSSLMPCHDSMTLSLLARKLILPQTCVVGAVTWQIENDVKQVNGESPPPSGCPENRLFVPVELRPQVIHWAHTSLLPCHPGGWRTMFAISQRFWWQSMEQEVWEYVEACSVCAWNKTSSRPPILINN